MIQAMSAERTASQLMSVEDYLEWEATQEQRYEYVGGMVYPIEGMAGGTIDHALIAANALIALGSQMRGKPCRPVGSDLKVRIEYSTHTRFYYPDLTVICEMGSGQARYHDKPVVIVEVASESTRRIDELEKKEAYLSIPSLLAYVQLEQEAAAAVVWRRGENGFVRETYCGLGVVIALPEIDAELSLCDVYEAVDFAASESAE